MDQNKKNTDQEKSLPKEDNGQTRRAALKKIALGGGIAAGAAALPSKWTKPIVDRVMVPAHAQTSPGGGELFDNAQNPKGRARTLENGKLFTAKKVGNKVFLKFVSMDHSGSHGGKMKSANQMFRPLGDNGMYHFYYEATLTIDNTKKSKVGGPPSPTVLKNKGVDCGGPNPPANDGKAWIQGYKRGVELVVGLWDELSYTLNSVGRLQDLPGVSGCGGNGTTTTTTSTTPEPTTTDFDL